MGFRGGGQAFRDFGPAQAARRWQQRRSSCRTGGGRKRELVADSIGAAAMEAHEGEVAAEQMDTGAGRPVADKCLVMRRIMICPVWFC